jgi:predicted DsbA family dithiol-disulfide isomerase
MKSIDVKFIGDISCPWCYIGWHELHKAISLLPLGVQVNARWVPFEIFPHLPVVGAPRKFHLTTIFGSYRRAEQVLGVVKEHGNGCGLTLNFERIERSINSFQLNRIIWKYQQQAPPHKLIMRFFSAFFSEGKDLTSNEKVVKLMKNFQWNAEQTQSFLASKEGFNELVTMRNEYLMQGVRSVPVIEIGSRRLLGAQPVNTLVTELMNYNTTQQSQVYDTI